MLLIKNDPKYNEQWPRALVPYKRIYGIDEPKRLPPLANDGKLSPHLPEGTPFGLVGTSSLYKRESYPNGAVPDGQGDGGLRRRQRSAARASTPSTATATACRSTGSTRARDAGPVRQRRHPRHPHPGRWSRPPTATAGRSRAGSSAATPTSGCASSARSRCASSASDGKQPLDPDGNPDTSFLAKIPADAAFTFQTLDKNGMVLNMAQTWHQLRPGEVRNDCGGCHAHSQKPTLFEDTAAARPDYAVFDLTQADAAADRQDERRVRQEVGREGRDRPALREGRQERRVSTATSSRSSTAVASPATRGRRTKPAGNLVLDDDTTVNLPERATTCPAPTTAWRWTTPASSATSRSAYGSWRQSECLALRPHVPVAAQPADLEVFGERLDGLSNDDFPTETMPGDPSTLQLKGKPVANTAANRNRADLDFTGSVMPPPDGRIYRPRQESRSPLTDEDR